MSVPENPAFGPITFDSPESVPPLTDFVRSINSNRTRIGKVYDFLLGLFVETPELLQKQGHSINWEEADFPRDAIMLLSATSAFPDLPNRKRLIELVESVMLKEDGK